MTRAVIFILLLLLLLCVPAVSATQYISFANPDAFTQNDIHMYGYNNTTSSYGLLGQYNTTSAGIAIPNGTDLMFVLKPQSSNPLDDPAGWLSSTFSYVSTNIVPIVVIIFLIGLLLGRK
jgi:hypothetical protein